MSQKARLDLDKLSFTDASSNVGELSFSSNTFTVSKPVSFSNGISASNITVSGGGTISVSALSNLKLAGDTSGEITVKAADTTTNYQIKLPDAQGGASTVLTNDGSGNLSWGAGGGGGANAALLWAIEGRLFLSSTPTSTTIIDINSLTDPSGSSFYPGQYKLIEYGSSNRSTNTITIPTAGWYDLKIAYQHPPNLITSTSGSQQSSGTNNRLHYSINGGTIITFTGEESSGNASYANSGSVTKYLESNDTITFYWSFQNSVANEEFFITGSISNIQYVNSNAPVFTGATSSTVGTTGDVPQPSAGQQNYLLHGDGTWKGLNLFGGATASTQGSSGLVPIPPAGFQNYKLYGGGNFRKPYYIRLYRDNTSSASSTGNYAVFEGVSASNNLTASSNTTITLPRYGLYEVSVGMRLADKVGSSYADWDLVDISNTNTIYLKLRLASMNANTNWGSLSSNTCIIDTTSSSITIGLRLGNHSQSEFENAYFQVKEL